MLALTEDAQLVCAHRGPVQNQPSQALVTVSGRRVLVEADPEGRDIGMCPNSAPPFKKCTKTLKVQQGYSQLVQVDGRRLCLDSLRGLTDGTPPGVVEYEVANAGQQLVTVGS
jgi:hypothetical protein